MMYSGVFHVGIPLATLAQANVNPGAKVRVEIEFDPEPLPTDVLPDDLSAALRKNPALDRAWSKLAPSRRREYVKSVINAKRDETRARRIAALLEALKSGGPARRTWSPKSR
jgi:hypothetical protein